jgi:RNA polymerase primary sigma factor
LLALERKEVADVLNKAMDCLTDREREVIDRHVTGEESYEEIGKSWDVTKERIRQIEAKALRKIRDSKNSMPLRFVLGQEWMD